MPLLVISSRGVGWMTTRSPSGRSCFVDKRSLVGEAEHAWCCRRDASWLWLWPTQIPPISLVPRARTACGTSRAQRERVAQSRRLARRGSAIEDACHPRRSRRTVPDPHVPNGAGSIPFFSKPVVGAVPARIPTGLGESTSGRPFARSERAADLRSGKVALVHRREFIADRCRACSEPQDGGIVNCSVSYPLWREC